MSIFAAKTVISFIVGFVWITTSSLFAEKLGPKIGGVIAGLPATVVVALLFIGLTQGDTVASLSTIVIPLVLSINVTFVLLFIVLSKKFSVLCSLLGSLVFWFFATFLISSQVYSNFSIFVLVGGGIIFLCYYILEKKMDIPVVQGKRIILSTAHIVFRGIVGGAVVFFSVIMSKIAGPTIAGIFASFPGLTVALIIIMYSTQSIPFLHSLLKNFIISGSINVMVFVISARYLILYFGIYVAMLLSLLVSILSAYGLYFLVNKKLS